MVVGGGGEWVVESMVKAELQSIYTSAGGWLVGRSCQIFMPSTAHPMGLSSRASVTICSRIYMGVFVYFFYQRSVAAAWSNPSLRIYDKYWIEFF